MQPACAETADFYRVDASLKLDPKRRAGNARRKVGEAS